MSTSADDKRKQRRIPVDLWIEVERGGELYYQRATNLSVGGAYFAQTIPLPLGTVVDLRFTLPGEEHQIGCKGEIVTAQGLGMGVHFLSIQESDRARIETLIEKQGG
ncbi:MAG: PilZ domain-containing protein [Myxococcales bacterium]|nr:PilZ domain-containing protein [Myxococcales bacterium]